MFERSHVAVGEEWGGTVSTIGIDVHWSVLLDVEVELGLVTILWNIELLGGTLDGANLLDGSLVEVSLCELHLHHWESVFVEEESLVGGGAGAVAHALVVALVHGATGTLVVVLGSEGLVFYAIGVSP